MTLPPASRRETQTREAKRRTVLLGLAMTALALAVALYFVLSGENRALTPDEAASVRAVEEKLEESLKSAKQAPPADPSAPPEERGSRRRPTTGS